MADQFQIHELVDENHMLKQKVARLLLVIDQQLGPCTGCVEAPEEYCPRHGRSYNDMVNHLDGMVGSERARIARAEALIEEWGTQASENVALTMRHATQMRKALDYFG